MNCIAMRWTMTVLVLMVPATAWAEQSKADPADEKSLHELHRAFLAAFNKGDVEAVVALHTPEWTFLVPMGKCSKAEPSLKNGLPASPPNTRASSSNPPLARYAFSRQTWPLRIALGSSRPVRKAGRTMFMLPSST